MPVSQTCVTSAFSPPNPLGQIKWSGLDATIDEATCTSIDRPIGVDTPPALCLFSGEDISGAGSGPFVSVGTNAPNYDDVVPATDLGSITTTGDYIVRLVGSKLVPVAWDTPLTLRVRSRRSAPACTIACTLICFPLA